MKSINIKLQISGQEETLLVIPDGHPLEKKYRLIKAGVEFCSLKENGELGWEVSGTPLNADELTSIGNQIRLQLG